MDDGASVEPLDIDEPRAGTEREVMLDLQRALLPAGLPVFPELSFAAGYVPAAVPKPLGGDWFDVVSMPDDAVGLVVGDAVGSGTTAVAVMGQLRAIAAERLQLGSDLDEVLLALDAFAAGSAAARGGTMCLAVLDRWTGALRYAARGHPAPLMVTAGGETRYLAEATGPPLALAGNRYRLASDTLRSGETLVLYTNGAVTRAGRTLGQGMTDLAGCVSEVVRRGEATGERALAGEICSAVTAGGEGSHHDDVSVVAATLLATPPASLTMTVPAAPDQLGVVRRRFSGWLRGFLAGPDDVVALELSVVEAVTNSIEHAFAGPPGTVRVDAVLGRDGTVRAMITDDGRWKPPTRNPGFRGRGLVMIREFCDELRLRTSSLGTTVRIAKALRRPVSLDGTPPQPRRSRPAPTDLQVGVRVEPDGVVVSVSGAVDSSGTDRLHAALLDAGRRSSLPLTIVLDDVTLLASAGLRTLYEHAGVLLSTNRPMRLIAADATPARDVLAVSGLDKLVEVLPNLPG